MFSLCYLNKEKIGCITSESRANPASIPASIYTAHVPDVGDYHSDIHTPGYGPADTHSVRNDCAHKQHVRLEKKP